MKPAWGMVKLCLDMVLSAMEAVEVFHLESKKWCSCVCVCFFFNQAFCITLRLCSGYLEEILAHVGVRGACWQSFLTILVVSIRLRKSLEWCRTTWQLGFTFKEREEDYAISLRCFKQCMGWTFVEGKDSFKVLHSHNVNIYWYVCCRINVEKNSNCLW